MTPEQIRTFRTDTLGMTQEQLADALSHPDQAPVHKVTVSNWERGHQQPPPYLRLALERLADGEVG